MIPSPSTTRLIYLTAYYFRAGYGSDASLYSSEKKFKTLPSDTAGVTFITGGDLGLSEMTKTLMKQAALQNPDFALIGGDVAYANAMVSGTSHLQRFI